jgi:hypothetical protein
VLMTILAPRHLLTSPCWAVGTPAWCDTPRPLGVGVVAGVRRLEHGEAMS